MLKTNLSLQKPLEDYIEYIEKLNPRSIPLLEKICTPTLSFQDPYHNAGTLEDTTKILKRRFKISPGGRYKVSDFTWGRRSATAYILWSYSYMPKKRLLNRHKVENIIIEGTSEVMFSPDGMIFSHVEFWGAHDGFDVKAYTRPFPKE